MQPFTQLTSRVVSLPVDNIDTDQIIPARFLKTTEKTGLGRSLFSEWRYIFSNNALKNGLLPVIVDAAAHQRLLDLAADPSAEVTVDLDSQTVRLPDGSTVPFPIDGFSKTCLLEGVDQLGYLLLHQTQVATYEQTHPARVDTLALV
jgi:3-isopropylmalate/(R)-2-methylmalate dehydratase small subunit